MKPNKDDMFTMKDKDKLKEIVENRRKERNQEQDKLNSTFTELLHEADKRIKGN